MSQGLPSQERVGLDISIEHATPNDAEAILIMKRATWLKTYVNDKEGVSKEDILKKFPDSAMPQAVDEWQRGIASETEDGNRMTFVAKQNGKVVGFTAPLFEEGKYRIGTMYVAPDAQGKGVGGVLMRKALAWLGPGKDIYLNVTSYNQNAIDFYKHFGFTETGHSKPLRIDEEKGIKLLPQTEMVLRADG